ncbi:protein-methionine-sulfoxide reductase heme-binding subunit MsrQ [Palleronia caenipelagi]|uniref:Protein-methionine-sulfoxide reductase heme-binding subunit MsrQ n=1 Tax=Palleronia caenipelagi TaxID=2489174 RepID=A0A547Q8N6_9RHOB|nr:protein-methionine-sulfoxide reductase heme-binding subunit MsrQ [Palleronia caenipelagi]TRD22746.1 protein-methionine-sulfoxide reductase heme-binding subunit MsrQ [Palleronia caenipelagi]
MTFAQRINGGLRRIPTWPVYVFGLGVPLWYLYLAITGQMGVEPINALERALGLAAMQMLVAVLAVTPLRKLTGVSLVKYRRAMALVFFFWVVCHLLAWAILDLQRIDRIWADIVKRPYITIGMVGFVLAIPLAVTSNNLSIRKMGPMRWRKLHKLTYPIAVLGAVHFVMVQKVWELEPLLYLVGIISLITLRVPGLRIPWPVKPAAKTT